MNDISPSRRREVFDKGGGRCHWCTRRCVWLDEPARKPEANHFTVEHIVPRSHRGGNGDDNVVGACHSCNQARNNILHKLRSGKTVDHMMSDSPDLRTKLINSIQRFLS